MAVFSLCPHMAEGARKLSGVSLIRALIPFMRAPLSWRCNYLPKTLPPNIITLVIRFHVNFGGTQTFLCHSNLKMRVYYSPTICFPPIFLLSSSFSSSNLWFLFKNLIFFHPSTPSPQICFLLGQWSLGVKPTENAELYEGMRIKEFADSKLLRKHG